MKHFARLAVIALVATAAPLVLHADTIAFNATGTNFETSGVLTTTLDGVLPGVFDITAISGEVNGVAITGLLPGSYNPYSATINNNGSLIYDNLLLSGSPVFDYYGVAFNIGSSGNQGNIFFDAGAYQFADSTGSVTTLTEFSSTSQTPEPSSFVLLGSGVLGAIGVMRKRLFA